jgi:hypothetical protein
MTYPGSNWAKVQRMKRKAAALSRIEAFWNEMREEERQKNEQKRAAAALSLSVFRIDGATPRLRIG